MLDIEKVKELTELYKKHISGGLSETDKVLLEESLAEMPEVKQIFDEASDEESFFTNLFDYYRQTKEITDEEVDTAFKRVIEPPRILPMYEPKRSFGKWIAAASILVMASIGFYFWQNTKQPSIAELDQVEQPKPQEIMPANGFSTLVLADGRKLVIDNTGNGVVATNGGKEIIHNDGLLSYQGNSREVVYNTLVTSRGKMMSLLLPDFSRVWLNAESSIKFPTAFTGDKRMIEITGEVYLEVTKNEKMPFVVSVNGMEVQVYGTSFNINAYPEESSIKTTLIEGRVSVKSGNQRVFIKPGQQVQVNGDVVNVINDTDVESVVAWKNGMTVLNRADLKSLLNSISRWYDVDVEMKGDVGKHVFLGSIPRRLSLQDVSKALENITGLKFVIQGRKLIVSQ